MAVRAGLYTASYTASQASKIRRSSGDVPFSAIRLRKPQTDSASVWQATLAQFAKHRAGVDMPDEFALDEAAEIFRSVFGTTTNRGATTPHSETTTAPHPETETKPEPKAKPKASVQQQAKPQTKPAKAAKSPLREALDNYGITDDEIRNYIREKKVCGNNEPWQVDDIPEKFAEWLMARMDAIAKKIKG